MSQPSTLEITILSAQGLKASSSTLFPNRRLKPFTTITTAPPPLRYTAAAAARNKSLSKVYQTKVDDKGGFNPIWGEKFQLPLDPTFFNHQSHSCIYLHLYTKNFLIGYTQLGWCQIPVTDILDGFLPVGSLRHLAYRLRAKDGSRGHGVVNVAVKLESTDPTVHPHPQIQWSSNKRWPNHRMNVSQQMVMGIPVTAFPPATDQP